MSEPRRRSHASEPPQAPSGYRQTRRSSTAKRSAKRAERQHRVAMTATRTWKTFKDTLLVTIQGLAVAGLALLVLLVIANGANTFARWNAKRLAERAASPAAQVEKARENVLFVGVEESQSVGFLAMRVDRKRDQVFGVAIPDGAFVDIPGRGFERIGEAFLAGPDVALITVSNFFSVQFQSYVAVPAEAYRSALTSQTVTGLVDVALDSNMTDNELAVLKKALAGVEQKNVALVPLPVKPIKLGDQTYFEPQREEIADLLKSWWGVDSSAGEQTTRVIVYNGAGVPGIAGVAAQKLIRSGLRVIDTKNADTFNYKKTSIVVKRGDISRGEKVREALGVGTVAVDISTADVTDVIVIIGKDYKPDSAEKGEE